MIDSKELRRLNWVNEEVLGIVKVEEITSDAVSVIARRLTRDETIHNDIYTVNVSSISPIPLTAEILLKCGFEWDNIVTHGDGKTTKGLFKDFLMMLPRHDNLWYAAPFGYPLMPQTTLYLHQLQNLYFSLTSKELNFTP